jgi:Asp-tRNA(Asn)/Glu-tRNA(Gln) amidotransferase A subunit family amidase
MIMVGGILPEKILLINHIKNYLDCSFQVKMRILMGTYALSAGYYDAYYKRAQQVTVRKVASNAKVTFLLFYLLTNKFTL